MKPPPGPPLEATARLLEVPCPEAPPEAAIKAVYAFVERCRGYAVEEIARREAEGREAGEWQSYLRFSDHTLRELEEGTLDGWFRRADEKESR